MIKREYYDEVVSVALANGIPLVLAQLMGCQSAFETANFTSNAFIHGNNGFGYKFFSGSKWQKGKSIHSTESDFYANYETFDNSILEVVNWIKRRLKDKQFPPLETIVTPENYAILLKGCGYYGGTLINYQIGLRKYFEQVNNNLQ